MIELNKLKKMKNLRNKTYIIFFKINLLLHKLKKMLKSDFIFLMNLADTITTFS